MHKKLAIKAIRSPSKRAHLREGVGVREPGER
jgi:hypothetical protein